MTGHGAVELVLAGLQGQRERRRALGDGVADLLDSVPLDLDVMRDPGLVHELDGDLAGGGGELGLVEREVSARVGREHDGDRVSAAPAPGVFGGGLCGRLLRVIVVVSPAGRDGDDQRESGECKQ